MMSVIPKIGFKVTKNIQNDAEWPFTTNLNFICNIYKAVYLKNRLLLVFDAGHILVLLVTGYILIDRVSHVI